MQWIGGELEREKLLRDMTERARTDGLTGLANHREVMSRLTEEIERAHITPLRTMDKQLDIRWSVGVSGFDRKKDTKTAVVNRADQALYEAKDCGGDCVVVSEH